MTKLEEVEKRYNELLHLSISLPLWRLGKLKKINSEFLEVHKEYVKLLEENFTDIKNRMENVNG